MIQDFQQTTIASTGLQYLLRSILFAVATACQLVWQRDSWNYDEDSAVISVFASLANRAAVPPRPSPSSQRTAQRQWQ